MTRSVSSDSKEKRKPSSKKSRVTQSRLKAWECLRNIREKDSFAQNVIASLIDKSKMSASDKAFATKLVLGVVSFCGSLDYVLDRCMSSPNDVKPDVRDALRISAYEILYLEKDGYAAVDQGVELVGAVARRAKGVANAVLRGVCRAKDSFPFGDPDKDLRAFSLKNGFPFWLVEKLDIELGSKRMRDFVAASNEVAPLYIAVNSVKADEANLRGIFAKKGYPLDEVVVSGIRVPGCYRASDRRLAAQDVFFKAVRAGEILVSDASAQCIAYIVSMFLCGSVSKCDTDGFRGLDEISFLELCSGRATKTILIQSDVNRRMSGQLRDFSVLDNIGFKTKLLKDRVECYGIHVENIHTADASGLGSVLDADMRYDCIFIDAPCSGLGTLRRHPEIRWRLTPDVIKADAKLDMEILESAASFLKSGGHMVYATCTVTYEENLGVIKEFLKRHKGEFAISKINGKAAFSIDLVPGGPDSHFCIVLQKSA